MKRLDQELPSSLVETLGGIVKGEVADLQHARHGMKTPPWEFSCDLYDQVKDFFIYKDKGGAIGHISWVYYRNDPNRIIRLGLHEGEIKYSLTLEPYRGKNLYPLTLIQIQKYLRGKGYRRVFICVEERNLPSIRGIEKAGFKTISRLQLIKVMGIQLSKKYYWSEAIG